MLHHLIDYAGRIRASCAFGYITLWTVSLALSALLFLSVVTSLRKLIQRRAQHMGPGGFRWREFVSVLPLLAVILAIYFLLPSSIVRIVRSQVRILLAEACTGLLVSQGANFDQRGALVAHRIDQGSGGDKAQVQLLLRSLQMTFTNDGLALHLNDATDNMQEWFGSRLDSGGTAMAVDIYRIQRFTVPRESPQQALSLGLTMYSTPEIPFKGEGGSPRLGWKADDSDVAVIVR